MQSIFPTFDGSMFFFAAAFSKMTSSTIAGGRSVPVKMERTFSSPPLPRLLSFPSHLFDRAAIDEGAALGEYVGSKFPRMGASFSLSLSPEWPPCTSDWRSSADLSTGSVFPRRSLPLRLPPLFFCFRAFFLDFGRRSRTISELFFGDDRGPGRW